eukprot:433315-Pyramimonas_sp.AAC.1
MHRHERAHLSSSCLVGMAASGGGEIICRRNETPRGTGRAMSRDHSAEVKAQENERIWMIHDG